MITLAIRAPCCTTVGAANPMRNRASGLSDQPSMAWAATTAANAAAQPPRISNATTNGARCLGAFHGHRFETNIALPILVPSATAAPRPPRSRPAHHGVTTHVARSAWTRPCHSSSDWSTAHPPSKVSCSCQGTCFAHGMARRRLLFDRVRADDGLVHGGAVLFSAVRTTTKIDRIRKVSLTRFEPPKSEAAFEPHVSAHRSQPSTGSDTCHVRVGLAVSGLILRVILRSPDLLVRSVWESRSANPPNGSEQITG